MKLVQATACHHHLLAFDSYLGCLVNQHHCKDLDVTADADHHSCLACHDDHQGAASHAASLTFDLQRTVITWQQATALV